MKTDASAIAPQLPFISQAFNEPPSAKIRDPRPFVLTAPLPYLTRLPVDRGADAIFFGDAAIVVGNNAPASWRTLPRITAIKAPNVYVDARRGWVDATLAYKSAPQLAQALGGALTLSRNSVLDVNAKLPVLVYVRGALLSVNGRVLYRSKGGYHWIRVPLTTTGVRCDGLCVLAAQTERMPPAEARPLPDSPNSSHAVAYQQILPFLIRARLVPGTSATIDLNCRYDRHWLSIMNYRELTHLKIDSAANAWILPVRKTAQTIWFFEVTALVQLGLEIIAIACVLALFRNTSRVR
jgi:hypothetical protein